jgi:hypothetical protein
MCKLSRGYDAPATLTVAAMCAHFNYVLVQNHFFEETTNMKAPLYTTLDTLLDGNRAAIFEGTDRTRLAIERLQNDNRRQSEDDIFEIVALEPCEQEGEGYRRTGRWFVDRDVVYDGSICDGFNELSYGVEASESKIAELLMVLAGAVRITRARKVAA